jgi:hypothetical protein
MIEYQLEYLFLLVVAAALLLLMRSFFKGLGAAEAPQGVAVVVWLPSQANRLLRRMN